MTSLKVKSRYLYLIGIAIFLSFPSYSQDQTGVNEDWKEYREKVKGTYQIQMNTRLKPSVHISTYRKIHNKRHETDTVYIKRDQYSRIMILPEKVIERESFEPIPKVKTIQ